MIDWHLALREVNYKFDNEGAGGTASYCDPKYGDVDFMWDGNKSKIMLTWYDSEPLCLCGNFIGHVDCDCEWTWFQDTKPKSMHFTKSNYKRLKEPNLFS